MWIVIGSYFNVTRDKLIQIIASRKYCFGKQLSAENDATPGDEVQESGMLTVLRHCRVITGYQEYPQEKIVKRRGESGRIENNLHKNADLKTKQEENGPEK